MDRYLPAQKQAARKQGVHTQSHRSCTENEENTALIFVFLSIIHTRIAKAVSFFSFFFFTQTICHFKSAEAAPDLQNNVQVVSCSPQEIEIE